MMEGQGVKQEFGAIPGEPAIVGWIGHSGMVWPIYADPTKGSLGVWEVAE